MSQPAPVTVELEVNGADVTSVVVWNRSTFQAVAGALPGTCSIVFREPRDSAEASAVTAAQVGANIKLRLNGELCWQGYLFTVEKGYAFDADPSERQWVLSGVDLNILFDKLILWNHDHPTRSLDGDGTWKREKTEGGYVVAVPRHTYDREYIWSMVGKLGAGFSHRGDTDLYLVSPSINTVSQVSQVGQINPDGKFTPPTPGLTFRAFMQDVSANVQRSTPGSTIWYISPSGYLVYKEQDTERAIYSIGDNNPAPGHIMVKGLRISSDISRIKNDVLIFTGNLNPDPNSTQSHLLYRHAINSASVSSYGRFQYSEVLGTSWLQGSVNARASKILAQEGIPAGRMEFTTFEPGLRPGDIVDVFSEAHGISDNYPIRSIEMSFLTPSVVQYRVQCSYDTQDPWGLLLALKRPPSRGFVQPAFKVIDRTKSPLDDLEPAETYTLVKEYPRALNGHKWQCSYAYIKYSMVVFVGGLRKVSVPEEGTTVGFKETDPDNGIFYMDSAGKPYVEYHVWHNLDNQ